jgi:hypothetical protein
LVACGVNWANCPGFPPVTKVLGWSPRVRSLGLCRSEGLTREVRNLTRCG